jgi:hypothetical protein
MVKVAEPGAHSGGRREVRLGAGAIAPSRSEQRAHRVDNTA